MNIIINNMFSMCKIVAMEWIKDAHRKWEHINHFLMETHKMCYAMAHLQKDKL